MKKAILLFILALLCSLIFANPEIPNLENLTIIHLGAEGESYLVYDNNDLYFVLPFLKMYAKLDRKMLAYDKDGFQKFTYKNHQLLIIDGGINQYFKEFENDGKNNFDSDYETLFHNRNVKVISASSSYSEYIKDKKVNYTPDNLFKCFVVGCTCHPYWWNDSHVPWVEGAEGNGLGENVSIEFNKPVESIAVLNGFVDQNNMKLFKENSRVKQIKVEDVVNKKEQIIDFDDKVYFKSINFIPAATSIKITILKVYEGSKYKDTCISAIKDFAAPQIKRPEAEQKDMNLQYRNNIFNQCKLTDSNIVLEKYFSDASLFESY